MTMLEWTVSVAVIIGTTVLLWLLFVAVRRRARRFRGMVTICGDPGTVIERGYEVETSYGPAKTTKEVTIGPGRTVRVEVVG